MDKPEKKEYFGGLLVDAEIGTWNNCCDAHDAWLPGKEEIRDILFKTRQEWGLRISDNKAVNLDISEVLAEAISKRLGKEEK